MRLSFRSVVIEWRGPSPYFFAEIPTEHADEIRRLSPMVSYGWGVIPVAARIKGAPFTTSLFPKGASYLLPLKADVRRRTSVTAGDEIDVELTFGSDE